MLERVGVFVFSVLLMAGSLGLAVWLITTGQAFSFDGLFLLLVCGVFALASGICAFLVIKAGMQAALLPAAAKTSAKPAANAAAQPQVQAR